MTTEKRLIDANEIEELFYNQIKLGATDLMDAFDYALEDAQTVDAVPVVRCKDCKHYDKGTGWCNQHSHFYDDRGRFCLPWESMDWKMFDENDYCSYGERKDNE